MRVIHPLKMDLVGPWGGDLLHMVQGDSNTRVVELQLFSNGVAWEPLEVSSVVVAFKKPDQTKGFYRAPYTLEQNKVQVVLAPQVLTAPGKVTVAVVLLDGEEDSLASFPFGIMVAQNPEGDVEASEDYFDYINPLVKKALEETLKAAETSVEKSEQAAAQAAAFAKTAEEKAALADQALALADQADKKVDALRGIVSKFHSNIVEEAKGNIITLDDASDMELAGLRIFGKTIQNGTPTPDAPIPLESVGDGGSVTVTAAGKNLFVPNVGTQTNGGSVTVSETGLVTINGTFSENTWFGRMGYVYCSGMLTATLNWGGNRNGSYFNLTQGTAVLPSVYDLPVSFEAVEASTPLRVDVVVMAGTYSNLTASPMIRMASITDDTYEPYKEPTTTAVTFPNELVLPGIKVDSGGNYTDASGQQWICDEVDFVSGKYVQRVSKVVLDVRYGSIGKCPDTSTEWQGFYLDGSLKSVGALREILSDKFAFTTASIWEGLDGYKANLGATDKVLYLNVKKTDASTAEEFKAWLSENPVTVKYVIESPIDHDLSADELAQYAALHTNYPNTTIFNDGGAGMEVKYVADTKLYIDKKFAQLATALVNNV